jgi:hypothetical protein
MQCRSRRNGGNSSVARLDTEHATESAWNSKGARAVCADVNDAKIERSGSRTSGRRAAGRHFCVPGITRDASQGTVAHTLPSELRHACFAEHDCAPSDQTRCSRCVLDDRCVRRGATAFSRRNTRDRDVVLDSHGHAIERTERVAAFPARGGCLCLLHRTLFICHHKRVYRLPDV